MHGFTLLGDETLRWPMHHHKRDWNKYNKELVNRGKIHFGSGLKFLKVGRLKRQRKTAILLSMGKKSLEQYAISALSSI
jgi:hypothetical protein